MAEYLCQVEETQLLDESIRSTRNTLYISNFPWKQNLEFLWDRIFVIWEMNGRNPRNFKFSNKNILQLLDAGRMRNVFYLHVQVHPSLD